MPENFDDLKSLRGVGNKTASVVTCVALGGNALPVDTHVFRLAHRLGLSDGKTPDAVMNDLKAEFPEKAGMTCITRSFSRQIYLQKSASVVRQMQPSTVLQLL